MEEGLRVSIKYNCSEKMSEVANRLATGSYVHILNYHNTPFTRMDDFEKQLEYSSRYFSSVGLEDLDNFYKTGKWNKKNPGLIFAFYNGYRNNFDVIYPLLEKYGFIGWFFVATEFISLEPEKQYEFGKSHTFNCIEEEYKDGRYAMSWEELRILSQKHIVCSHTRTHSTVITATASDEDMKREIVLSATDIKTNLNIETPGFCWLGGEEFGACPEAVKYVYKAGYQYMIGNYKLERI